MMIRLATPHDAPDIESLVARSVRELHKEFYSREFLRIAIEQLYGLDWQLIQDQSYYVAEVGGDIVGSGGWSHRNTLAGAHGPNATPGEALDPEKEAARIRAFYVDPQLSRTGIGTQLLKKSEEAARSAGFCSACLTATVPAVCFYLRRGYAELKAMTLPMSGGLHLDVVLMQKSLRRLT